MQVGREKYGRASWRKTGIATRGTTGGERGEKRRRRVAGRGGRLSSCPCSSSDPGGTRRALSSQSIPVASGQRQSMGARKRSGPGGAGGRRRSGGTARGPLVVARSPRPRICRVSISHVHTREVNQDAPAREDLARELGDVDPRALALEDVAERLKVRVPSAHGRVPYAKGGDVGLHGCTRVSVGWGGEAEGRRTRHMIS